MAYDTDTAVLTDTRTSLKAPRSFAVVFHNDNATTFEFVCIVLMTFFDKTPDQAVAFAQEVHTAGRGVAGIYSRQIAEAKQAIVLDAARAEGHDSFTVSIEEA